MAKKKGKSRPAVAKHHATNSAESTNQNNFLQNSKSIAKINGDASQSPEELEKKGNYIHNIVPQGSVLRTYHPISDRFAYDIPRFLWRLDPRPWWRTFVNRGVQHDHGWPLSTSPSGEVQQDLGQSYIPDGLISGTIPAIWPSEGNRLKYHSLARGPGDIKKPELIRILIVHKGYGDQPLECSIKVVLLPRSSSDKDRTSTDGLEEDEDVKRYKKLGREQPYTALSYSWEGQESTERVQIRYDGTKTLPLYITRNLYEALIEIRNPGEDRYLWADAVCMDQGDKEEKNQQLPLMPRIYGEAEKVCVWLGNEDKENAAPAFGLIKKIRKWESHKSIMENTTCAEWDALMEMMKRGWFRRRWIVQEIVLAGADNAVIWWGSERIPWVHFAQAVVFFERGLKSRVKEKYHSSGAYNHHPDMFGEIQQFNATRLVDVTANIVSRRDDGRVVRKRENLESLISILTPFDTGQLHDIVYAVLSLAKDVSAGPSYIDLKTELRIEDLPAGMRKDCDVHATSVESTQRLPMGYLLILLMLGICLPVYGSQMFKHVSQTTAAVSDSKVAKTTIYTVLIIIILELLVHARNGLFDLLVGTTFIDRAITLARSSIWVAVPRQRAESSLRKTKRGRGNNTNVRQDMQCDCERKRRTLNNVMRRLKLEKFPVDYEKGFDAVCDDLYTFATIQSMSLDMIFRPWAPQSPTTIELADGTQKGLPTWVRTLDHRPYKPDKDNHVQRRNPDTLVGEPGASPYQASGNYRSGWKFERDGNTQILSVRGFQLDRLEKVGHTAESGSVPRQWLRDYRRPQEGEFSAPQAKGSEGNTPTKNVNQVSTQFWRTLIAGKGPKGQNPPLSYSLVCEEYFNKEDSINLGSERNLNKNQVLGEVIERVLSVIWGRKMARTTKFKRLALLPEETESGDVICILYGCSVPVVLRKITEKTSMGEEMWELIGECYVYEMMAGEALAERSKKVTSEKEFYSERTFKIR